MDACVDAEAVPECCTAAEPLVELGFQIVQARLAADGDAISDPPPA
jgi:hypothetical protein